VQLSKAVHSLMDKTYSVESIGKGDHTRRHSQSAAVQSRFADVVFPLCDGTVVALM